MDPRHVRRLVAEAQQHPERITESRKFWNVDFFNNYLQRAESLILHDPEMAPAFLRPAPALVHKIAANHQDIPADDFLLLAYSYRANASRRLSRTDAALRDFTEAELLAPHASDSARAVYFRYRAKLSLLMNDESVFEYIGEAIKIHKQGELVHRHELGQCLVLLGVAHHLFGDKSKILPNFTASLSHLDPARKEDYYCALHNLAAYAVVYGTSREEAEQALDYLRTAKGVLTGRHRHQYAKSQIGHLLAIFHARIGEHGAAELGYRNTAKDYRDRSMPFDYGLVQVDLCRLFLAQRREADLRQLAADTARDFKKMGSDAAGQALSIWRRMFDGGLTDQTLLEGRHTFFENKKTIVA